MAITCTQKAKPFGQPSCIETLERAAKLCFVAETASDGTKNTILSTDTVNTAFVEGKINETDSSKKWYITPELKLLENVRADDNTEDIEGIEYFSSKAPRTYTFFVTKGASPQLYDQFTSRRNITDSFYEFSVANQIGGNGRIADELRPLRIEAGSLRTNIIRASKEGDTVEKVQVMFTLSSSELDEDLTFLSEGDGVVADGLNITDFEDIKEVIMQPATGISTTGFTVDMNFIYGDHFNKIPYTGAVVGDFTLVETFPTPGAIVITSVTATAVPGQYTFVIPAATSADLLNLSFTSTGFYGGNEIEILIP